MQSNYKELIQTIAEVLSVETALRHKITTDVNAKYTTALRGRNPDSIKKTTNVILRNLFGTYWKITPHMITQHEDVVKQMTFDMDAPIDTVFNDAGELGDIYTASLNTYTNPQYTSTVL